MKIYTTAPLEDPREARTLYKELEEIGYDGGFSFEAKHDPFLALAVASEHTDNICLGTAIAIAFHTYDWVEITTYIVYYHLMLK